MDQLQTFSDKVGSAITWQLELPTPEPVPSMFAYRRERWLALASSLRRLVNYLRYLRAQRGAKLDYLPIKLDIENVSRCNFRCTMCQVSDWPKLKRADDMTLEDFKRLIDEQYGVVEIKIQGMGEPTLGRDAYFAMIRYARSKRIWVRTITNASLLHINDNYKKLIDSGVNELQISIDGATKETFERIRRGSKFERVAANCKLINDYCDQIGAYCTKMWVVVQRDNCHELLDLVKLSYELGFKSLVFSLKLQDWGQEDWNIITSDLAVDDQVTPDLIQRIIDSGRQLGLKVAFWNAISKFSTASHAKLCPWPFERAFVSSDMRIVPCCMIANPEVADLGDARNFAAHWHGAVYQDFRQAHLEGRIPKICQGCYEWRD